MTARICNTPGCPNHAEPGTGRCQTHQRAPWRPGSSTRKETLPTGWRDLRASILVRDGRCLCQGCPRCTGQPCGRPPTDADHIGDRDDHTPANLRALCSPCHRHRSSSQGGRAPRT